MMKIKIGLILLLLTQFNGFSQESHNITWNKTIDWENNRVSIEIKSPLDINDSTLSSTRMKAENWIKDNLTNIFFNNILDIKIDSLHTVGETININPETYYKLDKLGENLALDYSRLTTNLEYLDSSYYFPIYPDFISVFYNQSQHKKLLKKLDHRDYGEFTGLIIYVPPNTSLYKKKRKGELSKVLLPRIFNEDMDIIVDYTMIEPEYMKKWGLVLYGNSFDESKYQNRIGNNFSTISNFRVNV